MSATLYPPPPLMSSTKVILALLDAYPEAAAIRDKTDQYMPLHHLIGP